MPLVGTPCPRCLAVGRTGSAQQIRDREHSYCKKCRREYAKSRYQPIGSRRERAQSLLTLTSLLNEKLKDLERSNLNSNPLLRMACELAEKIHSEVERLHQAEQVQTLQDLADDTHKEVPKRRTQPQNQLASIDNALKAMRAMDNQEQIQVLEGILWDEYPEIAHARGVPNHNNVPYDSEESSP